MKTAVLFALTAASLLAQSLTPTVSTATVTAGKTDTLTLTFTPGATGVAAIQWTVTLPAGATAAWTAGAAAMAAGKTVTCSADNAECVLAGLNATPLAEGAAATAILTLPAAARGAQSLPLAGIIAAGPDGSAVATTGGTASITVLSSFDLNGDGKVDNADLAMAVIQVLGGPAACTTADFNGDGACDVRDIILLALDSLSPNP